jgi:uncharacterized tellurite resistance protein B-like protein
MAIPVEDRVAFLKIMAFIAAADSEISGEEHDTIMAVIDAWDLSDEEANSVYSVPEAVEDLGPLLRELQNARTPYLLIQELLTLAYLDGHYGAEEREAIRQIAAKLGVSRERVSDLDAWVQDGISWRERGVALTVPE